IESDDGVEQRIVPGNLRQVRIEHLGSRDLALAYTGCQPLCRCEDDVVHKLLSFAVCINSHANETANTHRSLAAAQAETFRVPKPHAGGGYVDGIVKCCGMPLRVPMPGQPR